MAGLKPGDKISGGEIETKHGKLTGILVDNAVELVASKIPSQTPEQLKEELLKAQQNCFAVGLTTVEDCGLDYRTILFLDSVQKTGDLKIRIFAMLRIQKLIMILHFRMERSRQIIYMFVLLKLMPMVHWVQEVLAYCNLILISRVGPVSY